VTRTLLSRSKGEGQGHQAAFLTAVLARQAAAAVAWERVGRRGNCCYVAVCSAARGASAPTGGGEGRGHIVAAARPPTTCFPSMHTEPENRSEKFPHFQTRFPESFEKPT